MSGTRAPSPVAGEFRRSWRVVVAAGLGLGFGAGSSLYWFGVLIGPLTRQFGWSNSAISGWALILTAASNLFAPVTGLLADRFGARLVALVSIPVIAAGFAGAGLSMHSLGVLYFGAFVVGLAGSGWATYTRAVNSWFDAGRGAALGFAFAGIALTSMVGPRLTQEVVDTWGWRLGFVFIGLMTLVPLPAVFFWMHERRETAERGPRPAPERGYRMGEVLRLRPFWLIGVAGLSYFLCFVGVQFNLIPFLTAGGLSRSRAALYAGALGAFVLLGKLAAGALFDRLRAPFVLAVLLLVDAGAIAILALARSGNAILALGVVGFAHGAIMAGIPYCAVRYFGLKFFAGISGLIGVLLGFSAFGPLLFSLLRDLSGSYRISLLVSGGLVLAAALLFALLGLRPFLPEATGGPGGAAPNPSFP